jgi:oligosaccharide repeat unit polymerase
MRGRLALWVGAVVTSGAVGVLVALAQLGGTLSRPGVAAAIALLVTALIGLAGLRGNGFLVLRRAGPGVQVAALALALAFFVGVFVASPDLQNEAQRTITLLTVSVGAFLLGAFFAVLLWPTSRRGLLPRSGSDVIHGRVVLAIVCVLALAALLNVATGSAPLLSANVNSARFSGDGGVLGRLWTWIIGGLEWSAVAAGVSVVRARAIDQRTVVIFLMGTLPLVLLAGRSFLLVIALAILVAVAACRRVSLPRLCLAIVIGIGALGAAGEYRLAHSTAPGTRATSTLATIFQSAATGPEVFATVLARVPGDIPFQRGEFLVRDFEALLPFHPLGKPETADYWVTQVIRGRDILIVGGSPPTLAGGLYIDFGVPGIILGCAVLGAFLVALYRWVVRVRTIGAMILYCYLSAYVGLAAYSYISLKPEMLMAVGLAYLVHRLERRRYTAGYTLT